MRRLWQWLVGLFLFRRPRESARLSIRLNSVEVSVILLTNEQRVPLTLVSLDARDQVTRLDSVPVWTVSDPAVGTVVAALDGLSAVFTAAGPLGTTQVRVTADAAFGAPVRTLTATVDIQVEAGEAASLRIIPGTPERQ